MPEKYHINTKPIPPRRPRVGKYGVVDWREDCARCHNCVKKACVYDRYRKENDYISNLTDVDALYFDCRGCFSCVQDCTKGLLCLSVNPVYEGMGNRYWTPDIIKTTWLQAETAKIPVSGAGYGGPFSGSGFDAMWTDMSEIVRPTRDGIHGREYISTSVDIGRKPSFLVFEEGKPTGVFPPLLSLPMAQYSLPDLGPVIRQAAERTDLIAIVDPKDWPFQDAEQQRYLPHVAFYLDSGATEPPKEVLRKTRLVEIADDGKVLERIKKLKSIHPEIIVAIRVELNPKGPGRAIELAGFEEVEVIHIVADLNGNEIGVKNPRFIKDMILEIHTALIENGTRDDITLIAGGGIALPEHMAKAIICGTDLVTIDLPLMIALECQLCDRCETGMPCPAKLEEIDPDYGAGRMTNLIAAWHREARRLRGDVGRAMFFEDLEEETFGRLFGTRKKD